MIGGRGFSRAALVLGALAGCDNVFRILHVDPTDASGPADDGRADGAQRVDAAVAQCAAPALDDPFNGTNPCAPWGNKYSTNGRTLQGLGALALQLDPVAGANAGCKSSQDTYAFGSVTAIVNEIVTGTGTYNAVEIHPEDIQIEVDNGLIRFQTAGSVALGVATLYTPDMKWWRIRHFNASTIYGEYSTDGVTWVQLGMKQVTPTPAPVTGVELTAGANIAVANGQMVFDQLVICP